MDMDGKSYADYFICLLAGIYVAETIAPRLTDATCFEKFLLFGLTTYGGALMGSYAYKLLVPEKECKCGACCHADESDED